jgi:hemoglobin
MQRVTRWKMMFSTCLTAALLIGPARAEDKKPDAKAPDRSTLDESIYRNLRGIIDHGANLYNQGDWNGCYRLWEGTLMGLRPLLGDRQIRSWVKAIDTDAYAESLKALQSQLGDRPQLKDVVETGLANARQTPQLHRRAFVLRVVLDQVRAETTSAVTKSKNKPDEEDKATVPPGSRSKTLWDRLGGEAGVTKIVDDFVNTAANDPKVDLFRHNKVKLDAERVVKMKRELVEQISQATGGPLKYTGPDMKKVHKDMGISNEQYDAAVADLKKALEKNKVDPEDRKKILDAVENHRKEIVQPKKPEEKKPAEKESEEKKPEDKKPEDKKDGKRPAGTASISGTVRVKGVPLMGGIVSLVGKNLVFSASIAADGTYSLDRVKPGEYKVAIDTKANAKNPQVPAKYSDPDKSGLTYTVKEGRQTFDIDLK